MIPMILILLVFVFLIMRVLPGDPAIALAGQTATDAQLALIRHKYGLDLPLTVQFIRYLQQLFTGNLGLNITGSKPIVYFINQALPKTLELAVGSVLLGSVLGVVLGKFSAPSSGKKTSGVGYALTQLVLSLPVYWIALLLQLFFGVYLRVLPVTGLTGSVQATQITGVPVLDSLITGNLPALQDSVLHLIMPTVSIAIIIMAPVAAMTRANFMKVSEEDYIVTQKASGLPRFTVEYKYTLKNALLPVVTLIGVQFAGLVSGAVLVENVYSISGIGSLLYQAVNLRDFNLIQATVIYIGVMVSLTSLLIDIIYAVIDPRVKY
jgi:peptide/nickel transport system permease protein